ncbi:MAG: PBP1A family penicillin-binding protein [Deltaproteobacteria bacterium]|nr:PBP1A family penicillin-binding protein [Deltaproteobacteria bacterium]
MPRWTRRHKRLLKRVGIVAAIATIVFLLYCTKLFRDITVLMSQTPETRPSVIYSDLFTLKTGALYADTFLTERLADLKIAVSDTEVGVRWKNLQPEYPEAVLPADSPLRLPANAIVSVVLKDERVDSIFVDGQPRDAIALEPTPIARLAGAETAIRDYQPIDAIPTRLVQAIIAIEDQRFLEHHGFDPRSVARAIWVNLKSQSLAQGGSTLTQQLVKNLLSTRQKTMWRKLKELVLALLIEVRYSKEQILEKYLNEIYFGQIGALEVHGVAEAARYFFNKPLERLTNAEMALIAGVIRGPAHYSPYKNRARSLDRKDTVLRKMSELGLISKRELKAALAETLVFAPPLAGVNKAPYFVDYVKAQILDELGGGISAGDLSNAGLRVYTTLDLPLQRRADTAVEKTVTELEARYKVARPLRLEGLLVAADPPTGFVRALVGGRSYGETTFNRVLNMKRHVGSAFKPFAYLAAFLKGADSRGQPYSQAYMVDDEPWAHEYDGKKWSPKNYEKAYRGHITLREAFANSINIPMARIAMDVGVPSIADLARKLGIASPMLSVPSLTLGAVDLSAVELLQAYTVFANRGERVDLTTVRAVIDASGKTLARFQPQPASVVEAKHIDVLNDLLRAVTREGTAKIMPGLGYAKAAYGKTGTTNFYRDSWFAGFSQGLAAVTWAGFDELKVPDEDDEKAIRKFKPPAQLTGASAALPMWARFFRDARPSKHQLEDLSADPSLEKERIDRHGGCRATAATPPESTFEALFLPGTVPSCP